MPMLPQYFNLLDPERQRIFQKLKAFKSNFVLGGGTAIMLQIGHRHSYDFDCFADKEISTMLFYRTRKIFGQSTKLQIKTSEMIAVVTHQGVEVSFVWHPFPTIRPIIETNCINLFHLEDLIANKAYTIGRRNAWRDYVDLFFFLQRKRYSLGDIIGFAQKKFSGGFNQKLFLAQLTYFKDVPIQDTTFIKDSFTPSQIKSFLEKEVEKYVKNVLA